MLGAMAAAALALSAAPSGAEAPTAAPEMQAALAASRAAIGRTLGKHAFTATDGRQIRLSDLRGRPLVINMIYTSCSDICPTLLTTLGPKIEIAREALGRGAFTVATVGFDVRNDTPGRMRAFARSLGLGDANWLFLSGDEPSVAALAAETGFIYRRTAAGFDHSAIVTIVDPDGRVYRQVYGIDFAAPEIVEPLKALVLGTHESKPGVGNLLERIRLWCTIYDPRTGRYRIDYSLILSVALGTLCLAAAGVFLAREWRKTRRPGRKPSAAS